MLELGRVHHGNAIDLLAQIPPGSVDALITDPPYSSGGVVRSDRMMCPSVKYAASKSYRVFGGDNRDQRSWVTWMAIWLERARLALKEGAYAMVFTDWRQLPALTDAFQAGGLVWRGCVVWDKTPGARAPHKGYFKHQAEYVVWGSNGRLPKAEHGGPWPGVITKSVCGMKKSHQTEKPLEVMRHLVQAVPPGGLILDPFAGSGSTGVACKELGRQFIGFECIPEYVEMANERLAA